MKSKKGGLILILILTVFVLLIVIFQNRSAIEDKISDESRADMVKIAEEYKAALNSIKPLYEEIINRAGEELKDKEAIINLRSKLLELKMPAEFRPAHVELVLLLDKIEQGILAQEAQAEFKAIIDRYEWLREIKN